MRSRGFTLLELVVVLAILAMTSLLVLPNIGDMGGRTFNAQVREANALLNYARRTAVVTGRPVKAIFLGDSDDAAVEQQGVDDVWVGRGINVDYRGSAGEQQPVENLIEVTFFPEGGSTGGELIFTQNDRETIIVIDPFSGKVRTALEND